MSNLRVYKKRSSRGAMFTNLRTFFEFSSRHVGFKIQYQQWCEGSSPSFGTQYFSTTNGHFERNTYASKIAKCSQTVNNFLATIFTTSQSAFVFVYSLTKNNHVHKIVNICKETQCKKQK
jgi:hypothetical protein